MKTLLLSIFFALPVFSQQDSLVINNHTYYAGYTYLDSVKVDLDKLYLNPKNIKSMRAVFTNSSWTMSGGPSVTFITRKEKTELIKLDNFYKKDLYPIKFVVNSKNIQNPSETYIETSAISGVTILDATQGVMHDPPSITIIITTKADKAADKN